MIPNIASNVNPEVEKQMPTTDTICHQHDIEVAKERDQMRKKIEDLTEDNARIKVELAHVRK